MTEVTWIIHGVLEEHGVVYHTHGLDKYGSLELEMTLPLEKDVAGGYLNLIGLEIANGRTFEDNETVTDLFNVPVVFRIMEGVHDKEGDRHLRVIFPDANNKFPWDPGCQPDYARQL